jgi:hypothetical protein
MQRAALCGASKNRQEHEGSSSRVGLCPGSAKREREGRLSSGSDPDGSAELFAGAYGREEDGDMSWQQARLCVVGLAN